MAKTEAQWQAESDAHSLATAEEVKADPKRMNAAKATAKTEATELNKRAAAMNKVAGKKPLVKRKTAKGKAERKSNGNPFGRVNGG